jgi:hypothetical protein
MWTRTHGTWRFLFLRRYEVKEKAAEGRGGSKDSGGILNFSIRIKAELVRKIEELARIENRNRNNMIQCLLERAVKEEK